MWKVTTNYQIEVITRDKFRNALKKEVQASYAFIQLNEFILNETVNRIYRIMILSATIN